MEDWSVVKSKKKSKIAMPSSARKQHDKIKGRGIAAASLLLDEGIKEDDVFDRIKKLTQAIPSISLFQNSISVLSSYLASFPNRKGLTIVSLGLGDICRSHAAMIQFAYAICLRNYMTSSECKDQLGVDPHVRLFAFEPLFENAHFTICNLFGVSILEQNCYGRYDMLALTGETGDTPADTTNITVYFMPHCPHSLYCNVLWQNWETLPTIAIIGNSFTNYAVRRSCNSLACYSVESELREECDLIERITSGAIARVAEHSLCERDTKAVERMIRSAVEDTGCSDLVHTYEAFIDTSLHTFCDVTDMVKPTVESMDQIRDYDAELR